jgi:hypothetical protein
MTSTLTRHPFHGCPSCPPDRSPDNIYTAGKAERGVCHQHRTSWSIGANLTSQWRNELKDAGGDWDEMLRRQRDRWRDIDSYRDVGPFAVEAEAA